MFMLTDPTTETYIDKVLARSGCFKHNAPLGTPCFQHYGLMEGNISTGVCNTRARKAGFKAQISAIALQKR